MQTEATAPSRDEKESRATDRMGTQVRRRSRLISQLASNHLDLATARAWLTHLDTAKLAPRTIMHLWSEAYVDLIWIQRDMQLRMSGNSNGLRFPFEP